MKNNSITAHIVCKLPKGYTNKDLKAMASLIKRLVKDPVIKEVAKLDRDVLVKIVRELSKQYTEDELNTIAEMMDHITMSWASHLKEEDDEKPTQ